LRVLPCQRLFIQSQRQTINDTVVPDDLPAELYRIICSNHPQKDLRNLRLVFRSWDATAQRFLFQQISLRPNLENHARALTIGEHKTFSKQVKTLHYESLVGTESLTSTSRPLFCERGNKRMKRSPGYAVFRYYVDQLLRGSLLSQSLSKALSQQKDCVVDDLLFPTEVEVLNYLADSLEHKFDRVCRILSEHRESQIALLENGNIVAVDATAIPGDFVCTLQDRETQIVLHHIKPGSPSALINVEQQAIAKDIHH
jgi:hypothetical protein